MSSLSMSRRIEVQETSQVGSVRRTVATLAENLDFDATQLGKAGIVATEMATNIVRHGGGGEVLVSQISDGAARGIEMLGIDRGPGMENVEACLRDGFSSKGTNGTGLGGIQRQSGEFDIFSAQGKGTVVMSRLWSRENLTPQLRPLRVGAVSVPMAGEEMCGDGWAVTWRREEFLVLVVDGLGHGPQAADAARTAIDSFLRSEGVNPGQMLGLLHGAMRTTRGAAIATGVLDAGRALFRMAGAGNIAGSIWSPSSTKSLVSHNGTVGHQMPKVQEFSYPWDSSSTLVMHSDGLATRWRLDDYPTLQRRHPSIVAAVLYRDHSRNRDDVTVFVASETGE